MGARRFFLYPLSREGQGSGHLRRCRVLEKELAAIGKEVRSVGGTPGGPAVPEESGDETGGALAIVDRRAVSSEELERIASTGTPVLLDDDGPVRSRAPYLIDIIPGPRSCEPNLSDPGFMDLPECRRKPDAAGSILVSFGGEDPAGLTGALVRELVKSSGRPGISCTLPPGMDRRAIPPEVEVLSEPENLKNSLGDYGLVVCSYGLTAWEALAAGCAVLTVDPTPYHAMLSMDAGIPGIGHTVPGRDGSLTPADRSALMSLLGDPGSLNLKSASAAVSGEVTGSPGLAGRLDSLDAPSPHCAACGALLPVVVERFPFRSYYRCGSCGFTGMYRFRSREDEYGPAYFQQEYEAQYGRSYLEDFEAIKTMGASRLDIISRRAEKNGRLLDIGCAFGPFLDAAKEAGYRPHGTDVSEEGTAWVREELGFPAVTGQFPSDNPAAAFGVEAFDAVTLWYVIEHFADLRPVLERISSLVKPGGVLALSTPNGAGVSARSSRRDFLKASPADHYTIWTPRTARRLLARHGFRVYRTRVTGHHPERFPGRPPSGTLRHTLLGAVSRIFGLGDTFEVYAVRESGSGQK